MVYILTGSISCNWHGLYPDRVYFLQQSLNPTPWFFSQQYDINMPRRGLYPSTDRVYILQLTWSISWHGLYPATKCEFYTSRICFLQQDRCGATISTSCNWHGLCPGRVYIGSISWQGLYPATKSESYTSRIFFLRHVTRVATRSISCNWHGLSISCNWHGLYPDRVYFLQQSLNCTPWSFSSNMIYVLRQGQYPATDRVYILQLTGSISWQGLYPATDRIYIPTGSISCNKVWIPHHDLFPAIGSICCDEVYIHQLTGSISCNWQDLYPDRVYIL